MLCLIPASSCDISMHRWSLYPDLPTDLCIGICVSVCECGWVKVNVVESTLSGLD